MLSLHIYGISFSDSGFNQFLFFPLDCDNGASQVVLVAKNLLANAGDRRDEGLIPGSGRSPEAANGTPLQYSCLENSMDRRTWQATVTGHKQWDMTKAT